jgi:putative chitinase
MCLVDAVGRGCANGRSDVKTVQRLLNFNASRVTRATPLGADGVCGPATLRGIEAFQRRVVRMPMPDGRVAPSSVTLKDLAAGLPAGLSQDKLQSVMVNAEPTRIELYAPALFARMIARQIDTPRRQAHFLAQIGHESGELRFVEEIASGDAYEGRLDLGNTHPGDGRRFKGRGLIQLTGRANYRAYGEAVGVNLVADDNWKRVSDDPQMAVDVACWFWQTRELNALADNDDLVGITKCINGGLNGLSDRERQLARARFFLGL